MKVILSGLCEVNYYHVCRLSGELSEDHLTLVTALYTVHGTVHSTRHCTQYTALYIVHITLGSRM